jgi:hypothetical protein
MVRQVRAITEGDTMNIRYLYGLAAGFDRNKIGNGTAVLADPFVRGNFVYATNGNIAVRFPLEAFPEKDTTFLREADYPAVDLLISWFQQPADRRRHWLCPSEEELRACFRKEPCTDCHGEGLLHFASASGERYGFDCRMCSGRGYFIQYQPSHFSGGGWFIDTQKLAKLSYFAPSRLHHGEHLWFVDLAEGGLAIIPRAYPSTEALERILCENEGLLKAVKP